MRSFPSSSSGAPSVESRTMSFVLCRVQIHWMSSKPNLASRSLEEMTTSCTCPASTSPKRRRSPGRLKLRPDPTSEISIRGPEYWSGRLSDRYCFCRSRSFLCLDEETRAYKTLERRGFACSTLKPSMLERSKRIWFPGVLMVRTLPS